MVVWRPLESSSRISPVDMRDSPARALTRVDFPTPEDPRKTVVFLGSRYGDSASSPQPVPALMGMTGTPGAAASVRAVISAGLSVRSALVRRMTGDAPVSQAWVR